MNRGIAALIPLGHPIIDDLIAGCPTAPRDHRIVKTNTCACGQLIFFQNVVCVNCQRQLGFLPDVISMSSLDPMADALWQPARAQQGQALLYQQDHLYRKCRNYWKENVCNWMIPNEENEEFCVSCRLNDTIPDLTRAHNRTLWALAEAAKRRLVYSLLRFGLPIASKERQGPAGLAFRFLSDIENTDGTVSRTLTGHRDGIITLNIAEAEDPYREKVRNEMKEPYRTLLGHFRHEIGHYYWDRLIRDTTFLQPYRDLFGDERMDYAQSLQRYYGTGAPANWQDNFISAYATSHPWEDWAETWAHFLHIQDTLEVANDFGLVGKRILLCPDDKNGQSSLCADPTAFDDMIQAWSELAIALNSINRSMGLADLYPFILSAAVIAKLRFVYEVVQRKPEAASIPPPAAASEAGSGDPSNIAAPAAKL
jgi:hypothetical protein